jgi:hypothetical protein
MYINKEKYMLVETKQIEEIVEQFEIKDMVEKRLKKYNPKNNISWENIREEI